MAIPTELPIKCQKCAKSVRSMFNSKCDLCKRLEFPEEVLCHLNRCMQDSKNFKCYAFRPMLKVINQSNNKILDVSKCHKEQGHSKGYFDKLPDSDKSKYERALALQKLRDDPDTVIINLKYHFVWNVIYRSPVFDQSTDVVNFIHTSFQECNELVGGFVNLLWLAPDHVHLYVGANGDRSVEEMIQEIKRRSQKAILSKFAEIKNKLSGTDKIWDETYFTETIG